MTLAQPPQRKDPGLGPTPLPPPDGSGRGLELAGVVLSGIWIVLILAYVLMAPAGSDARTFGLMMTLLMVFLPLGAGLGGCHHPAVRA
jgi:hypothetical protein